MTEKAYADMLLTAAMQARLASASANPVKYAVGLLADECGAIKCGTIEASHVSAAWIEFADHVHLSINGTDDVHDWVQNLDARQAKIGGLACHAGFLRAANLIRAELICDLKFPLDKPIVIGGHSAGGAIAEILVAIMDRIDWREVVTFGAPRVWSVDSAPIFRFRARDLCLYRFVIAGDPVPALPFRKFRRLFDGAEYSHASQRIEITADGRVLLDRDPTGLRKAVGIAAGAWLYGLSCVGLVKNWAPTLLSRHYLTNYRERILSAVARVETK